MIPIDIYHTQQNVSNVQQIVKSNIRQTQMAKFAKYFSTYGNI